MLYKLDIDIRRTGRAHHFDLQRIVELVVRSHFCVCFVFHVLFRNRWIFPFTLKKVVFSVRPSLGFSFSLVPREERKGSTGIYYVW